jgi:hypothetical protein
LKAVGWPAFDALRGGIVVGFTGGRIGAVNRGAAINLRPMSIAVRVPRRRTFRPELLAKILPMSVRL